MSEFDPHHHHDPSYHAPGRGRAAAMRNPRTRQLLLIAGLALLALLVAVAVWSSTGTRGAERSLRAAAGDVQEHEKKVEEARQLLEQRLAELQEARAEAVVESERLDVERVRETSAGDVEPRLSDDEVRARESLRRADDALANDRRP